MKKAIYKKNVSGYINLDLNCAKKICGPYLSVLNEIDNIITIPNTLELLEATLEIIPMQLLSYYIAKARRCSIDKPRNLAKSVTVE